MALTNFHYYYYRFYITVPAFNSGDSIVPQKIFPFSFTPPPPPFPSTPPPRLPPPPPQKKNLLHPGASLLLNSPGLNLHFLPRNYTNLFSENSLILFIYILYMRVNTRYINSARGISYVSKHGALRPQKPYGLLGTGEGGKGGMEEGGMEVGEREIIYLSLH